MNIINALVGLVFRKLVKTGNLAVISYNEEKLSFGDGSGTSVTIRFTDWKAPLAFFFDPDLKVGELFMDQRLVMERGFIYDFLAMILEGRRFTKAPLPVRILDRWRYLTRRFFQHNGILRARANVAHHYDLDDRLYQLFLDPDRQYSCAYFETPDQGLDAAQLAKKRHIAAKLCLEPGNSILDIGCGWGGMAMYLKRVAQAGKVKGITLSDEQLGVARKRATDAGLAGDVSFELQDYRKVEAKFDRIVSVGMFEHVGIDYYDTYFKTCAALLNDNGVMLMHTIGNSDVPEFTNPWIVKYIFPGGHIPSLSDIVASVERSGLIVTDVEVLRLHYATTLRHWRDRFMARREEAVKLYDERFCRMWEFYLSMAETAFRFEDVCVFQVQVAKRQENTPLTRDYIVETEKRLRAAEPGAGY